MPQVDNIPMDVAPGEHVIAAKLVNGVKYLRTIPTDETGAFIPGGGSSSLDPESMFFDAALSNTVVEVKATAGTLHGVHAVNPNADDAYIQLFDSAAGAVTLGTDTPSQSYLVPGLGAYDFESTRGREFTTAISVAATTTPTGATALVDPLTFNAVYI